MHVICFFPTYQWDFFKTQIRLHAMCTAETSLFSAEACRGTLSR